MGLLLTHRQIQNGVIMGDQGGAPPPPPPSRGGPKLPCLFTEMSVADMVPGRGVPMWGVKTNQLLGSLCALPCVGYNYDPGGG